MVDYTSSNSKNARYYKYLLILQVEIKHERNQSKNVYGLTMLHVIIQISNII